MIKIYDVETAKKTILRRDLQAILDYPESVIKSTESLFGPGYTPNKAVESILASVRTGGDDAIREWSTLLDKTNLTDLRIPKSQLEKSYRSMPDSLMQTMKVSADRIRAFHELQPLPNWETQTLGGKLGQRVTPINRVGVYVPGGTAPLPSSLLMTVIPAQVAGVGQIVVCTPPDPHVSIKAAAFLCGVSEVFQVGGAQAVAAMAYGTESIPKVDKIVGAGNLFVTLAKQQVFGIVGLDGLAGPTETMVIADQSADPAWVASDLLAQAEHDILASAILLTPYRSLAESVLKELETQVQELSRSEIIQQSLTNRGGIVLTPDLETAVELADEYGSEHLCLSVEDPSTLAKQINNAGGFFLGEHSFEVLGDYIAGPSHIMPTGGTARFASPLNVMDFVKISSVVALDKNSSQRLSSKAAEFAKAESLTAHAAAAKYREFSEK